jgi:hypothetical protein
LNCPAVFFRYKGIFFSSFIVAAMTAATFAYYNHKFSRFNFIDFGEWIFYSGESEIFAPKEEAYIMIVFSSLQEDASDVIKRVRNVKNLPIIAIDLAQNRKPSENGVIFITAGINALLSVVHRFHITHSPCVLLIERQSGARYKQATFIERL